MLDYLYSAPSIFTMRDARKRFVQSDEILISGAGYVPLENGDIWRRRRTRGVARQMHAWFFYYFLRPFSDSYDKEIAQKLINLLRTWRKTVGLPPTRIPMAYHDEATAQRAITLTCLLKDFRHLITDEDASFIHKILSESANLLADQSFYSYGTNHGMYQDLALIKVSDRIPDGDRFASLAIQRLNEYFKTAFTPEGIHKEQSPEYHCIVSNHLREYIHFLQIRQADVAQELLKIFERTERYATMAISPIGKFPPVSDTSNDLVVSSGYSHIYNSAHYQYAITQGLLGEAPEANQLIAPHTGVAIYRENWEDPDSTYLYFSSAYNSDYHKHSDELSLYLIHRGIEILRESGPNGYEMDDPYTVYGFSSFAHNTLIVNEEGLPRTDPGAMNKVGLYGDAHNETGGSSKPAADFAVCGWNHRFSGVEHERNVCFWRAEKPQSAKTLLITDVVTSETNNAYQLLWHFGPEIRAQYHDDIVSVRDRHGNEIARIAITADTVLELNIIEGQSEPVIQGWYFPKMGVPQPAQTLVLSFTNDNAKIQTEISLV